MWYWLQIRQLFDFCISRSEEDEIYAEMCVCATFQCSRSRKYILFTCEDNSDKRSYGEYLYDSKGTETPDNYRWLVNQELHRLLDIDDMVGIDNTMRLKDDVIPRWPSFRTWCIWNPQYQPTWLSYSRMFAKAVHNAHIERHRLEWKQRVIEKIIHENGKKRDDARRAELEAAYERIRSSIRKWALMQKFRRPLTWRRIVNAAVKLKTTPESFKEHLRTIAKASWWPHQVVEGTAFYENNYWKCDVCGGVIDKWRTIWRCKCAKMPTEFHAEQHAARGRHMRRKFERKVAFVTMQIRKGLHEQTRTDREVPRDCVASEQ